MATRCVESELNAEKISLNSRLVAASIVFAFGRSRTISRIEPVPASVVEVLVVIGINFSFRYLVSSMSNASTAIAEVVVASTGLSSTSTTEDPTTACCNAITTLTSASISAAGFPR